MDLRHRSLLMGERCFLLHSERHNGSHHTETVRIIRWSAKVERLMCKVFLIVICVNLDEGEYPFGNSSASLM